MLKFAVLLAVGAVFSSTAYANFENKNPAITVVVSMNSDGEPEVIDSYYTLDDLESETAIYDWLDSMDSLVKNLKRTSGVRNKARLKNYINHLVSSPLEELSIKEKEALKIHKDIVNSFVSL